MSKDTLGDGSLRYDKEDLKRAVEVIRQGGIILYPTDTIWGIGCDATNAEAVKKIYEIKRREDSKAMLVLVDSDGALERCVEKVPDAAWMLMDAAVRPLTIIYDHPRNLASNLLASDGSVGIRVTKEPFSNALCRIAGVPIVSTSANISGQMAPSEFRDISEEIKKRVDYIVEFQQNENNKNSASNIIKIGDNGIFKIIR